MRHPIRSTAALSLALAGVLLAATPKVALAKKYPEPSVYPKSWELRFRHAEPKRIVVADVPGHRTPVAYWYLTYTIVNDTGSEQTFLPDFELVTEDGKAHRSDMAIPQEVFQAVKKREGNNLLEPATKITGIIHQGEDQARDGVAIWEEPAPRMGSFSIYVGGLCGEHVIMKDDDGKQMKDPDGSPIILRKTLELNYVIFGDDVRPDRDEVHTRPERWVMR